jgi:hypothetical protein
MTFEHQQTPAVLGEPLARDHVIVSFRGDTQTEAGTSLSRWLLMPDGFEGSPHDQRDAVSSKQRANTLLGETITSLALPSPHLPAVVGPKTS